MLADFGGRLAHRLAPERDQFVGAMELEHADVADLELHQGVRRIAGQPGAHDAVLENVESVDHRGHKSWRQGVSASPGRPASAAPPSRDHYTAVVGRLIDRGLLRPAERVLNDGAAAKAVA